MSWDSLMLAAAAFVKTMGQFLCWGGAVYREGWRLEVENAAKSLC